LQGDPSNGDIRNATTVRAPAKALLTVREFEARDATEWDRFVLDNNQGTFFHRIGWRGIFKDIFSLEPHYLVAERGGVIAGVLPLVFQRSLLFGNALIAAPFCVEGGPAALDAEADAALTSAALSLQDRTGAPYVEFRSTRARHPNWTTRKDLYATFAGPISAESNANLLSIPRKQRAVIRKTLESGLVSEIDSEVHQLYSVYSESVRNLGTPVFPKRYFATLKQVFGSDCDIVIVKDGTQAISAVLNFYFRDTVLPYYGGGKIAARRNGANDFLYWEVIRRAAERGYSRFDFGRSKVGTGAFAFKKNWGFEPHWLEYEYHLRPGCSLPDKNPLNPKFSLLIEAWKRLPLPVANLIGPLLVRGLG
jgi:FemAB-related protein (PEP-CTERM system-associated)